MSLQEELIRIREVNGEDDVPEGVLYGHEEDESQLQTPDNPVWPSEQVGTPLVGHPHERHQSHSVINMHGHLDMLQHVRDIPEDAWVATESTEGPAHKPRGRKLREETSLTFPVAALSWDARTYAVDRAIKIAEYRDERLRLVITNNDAANPVFLLAQSPGSPVPGVAPLNAITLAKGASKEFRTRAEIWAYPFALGTPQAVDVQDEFGFPYP